MEAVNLKSEFFFADNLSFERISQSEETGSMLAFSSSTLYTSKQNDTTVKPQQMVPPTPEQIRMWQHREVNKMFHGQSKEINLQGQQLIETKESVANDLVLPSRPVAQHQNDWFTIIVIISIVLIATVRHSFGNYLTSLFQGFVNYSTASRMFRERNISLNQGEIRLEIFSYFVTSLFFYQIAQYFNLNIPFDGYTKFAFALGLVFFYFMVKKLLYLLMGFIFENSGETGEFLYNFGNYIRVTGIVALPIVLLIAWAPFRTPYPLFATGLTIISILHLILIWRGIRIFLKKQFSIFYLFLYLCTLEILPLLVLLKLISA
jgi:hypothetical protein